MKRSITRWTTTLATAAVLGLPAVGSAQSPSTTPPRTTPQAPGTAASTGAAQQDAAGAVTARIRAAGATDATAR